MPPYLPYHREAVAVSGVAEIVGALAVIAPATRRPFARWWLIALLVAVFPANVHMAVSPEQVKGLDLDRIPRWTLWARLPLQPLCVWWVWRATAGSCLDPVPALAAELAGSRAGQRERLGAGASGDQHERPDLRAAARRFRDAGRVPPSSSRSSSAPALQLDLSRSSTYPPSLIELRAARFATSPPSARASPRRGRSPAASARSVREAPRRLRSSLEPITAGRARAAGRPRREQLTARAGGARQPADLGARAGRRRGRARSPAPAARSEAAGRRAAATARSSSPSHASRTARAAGCAPASGAAPGER